MAILGYRRAARRPQYAQRLWTIAVRSHALVAKAWPRPRGKAKTQAAQINRDAFRNRQRWLRVIKEHERAPMREGLKEFNAQHVGLRGSSITRLRDIEDARLAGRAWAIKVPGHGTFWPERAAQDISDALDWLEPLEGSLLVRTSETWLNTVACSPGGVLTLTYDMLIPTCCEPAREAKRSEAVESSP